MKVGQFSYKQQTGLATIFTAETEDEILMLEKLRSLIEDGEGILSRKSFSFEDGEMSIDIDKKTVKQTNPLSVRATIVTGAKGKGTRSKDKTDPTK